MHVLMSTMSVETGREVWILWNWNYTVLQASQHVYWGRLVCSFDGWAIPSGPMLTDFTLMRGIQVQVSMLTQQALSEFEAFSLLLDLFLLGHILGAFGESGANLLWTTHLLCTPVRVPRALRHTFFWLKRCFMAAIAIKLAHSQCCTIATAASHIGWRLTTGFSRFIELVISPWKGEGVPNSHSCFNRLTVLRLLGASWDK